MSSNGEPAVYNTSIFSDPGLFTDLEREDIAAIYLGRRVLDDHVRKVHWDFISRMFQEMITSSLVLVIKTFGDLSKLHRLIKDHTGAPDYFLVLEVASAFAVDRNEGNGPIIHSINLSVRLWLTVSSNFVIGQSLPPIPPGKRMTRNPWWESNADPRSLKRFLARQFVPSERPGRSTAAFQRPFPEVVRLLAKLKVKIVPTDDLGEHLQFDESGPSLKIYRLERYIAEYHTSSVHSPFPPGLAAEATATFGLLIPNSLAYRQLEDALDDELRISISLTTGSGSRLYVSLRSPASPDYLDDFPFWRDRILALYNVLERRYTSAPLWFRVLNHPVYKYLTDAYATRFNLFIGLFALYFTTFSFAIGILGVYHTILQTKSSQQQYALALAQACLIANATDLLPDFC